MKPNFVLLIGVAAGAVLGVMGTHIVTAQQYGSEKRTQLVNADLVGVEGQQVHMWRTDIGPGVVGVKHYPSGHGVYLRS